MPNSYVPINIFIMAPGAFFVLASITAIQNKIKEIGTKKGKDMSKIQSGCGGNCAECNLEPEHGKDTKKAVKEAVKSDDVSDIKPAMMNKEIKVKEPFEDSVVKANEPVNEVKTVTADEALKDIPPTEETVVNAKSEINSESVSSSDDGAVTVNETHVNTDSSGELELIDLSNLKSAIKSTNTVLRKPVHKKSSLKKAEEMLKQAEEKSKEEEKND